MGKRIRAFDWASTPLGAPETWPPSLLAAVGICMGSELPMFVWWGPELINIYNDAYAPVLGKRHPDVLGKPARQIWSDIWPDIAADVEGVFRGTPVVKERVRFVMERNGYPEEKFFTYSHSPIFDEAGQIRGLFQVCTDETAASSPSGSAIDSPRRKRNPTSMPGRFSTASPIRFSRWMPSGGSAS